MTNRLLRVVYDPGAWIVQDCEGLAGGKLPGVGVHCGDLPLRG